MKHYLFYIAPTNCLLDFDAPELFEDKLELALLHPDKLMNSIENFIKETHPYQDGNSSKRMLTAVDEMIEQAPLLQLKPLNLLRKLKLRKKLNYWKLYITHCVIEKSSVSRLVNIDL